MTWYDAWVLGAVPADGEQAKRQKRQQRLLVTKLAVRVSGLGRFFGPQTEAATSSLLLSSGVYAPPCCAS